MQVLLINLDNSSDRLDKQTMQFNHLGIPLTRLAAISVNDFDDDTYQKLAFSGQRPLKKSELACFLSHKKAWQCVLECNKPCVILEDDVVLVQDFKQLLDDISKLTNVDFINLEVHGRKKTISKQPVYSLTNNYQLYSLFIDRSGAAGYVLFPSGARILLDYVNQRAIGLADEFIYSCQALRKYQVEPAALLQSDKCQQYGVTCNTIFHSVIAQVSPNIQQLNLTFLDKIKFKTNRIVTQIKLGLLQLKHHKGIKREIQVDAKRF